MSRPSSIHRHPANESCSTKHPAHEYALNNHNNLASSRRLNRSQSLDMRGNSTGPGYRPIQRPNHNSYRSGHESRTTSNPSPDVYRRATQATQIDPRKFYESDGYRSSPVSRQQSERPRDRPWRSVEEMMPGTGSLGWNGGGRPRRPGGLCNKADDEDCDSMDATQGSERFR